jgi:hypothetical protein
MSGSLHSTSTTTYHLSIALLTVSHQEIGLTRVIRKRCGLGLAQRHKRPRTAHTARCARCALWAVTVPRANAATWLPAVGDMMRWGVVAGRASERENLLVGQGEESRGSPTRSDNGEAVRRRRTMMFDDSGRRAMARGDAGMVLQHRGVERGVRPNENR